MVDLLDDSTQKWQRLHLLCDVIQTASRHLGVIVNQTQHTEVE